MNLSLRGLIPVLGALLLASGAAGATEAETSADRTADPSISRFVQAVVASNPRVQAARAALDASTARRDAASRPLYNPSLLLEAEHTDIERTQTIGISQTIDWADKREARTDVAESGIDVARAEYFATRWGVMVELLNGLSQYRTRAALDELASQRVRLMNEFMNIAQRRYDSGDLAQIELDVARIAATDARIQKATAAAGLAEARQAVRNLTSASSPPSGWPGLTADLPPLTAAIDPAKLIMALPEVLAAQNQVRVADALVELREREKRPDPTLSLAGGSEGGEALIGLNVTIPLFVRNRFSHEVTAALAERREAQQIADDVIRRASARIASAAERYRLAQGAWIDWDKTGSASLERQKDLLQRLWRAGELGTTDYLVQIEQTLDVEQDALDLRESLWRAWFEWLAASGRIDSWLGLEREVQALALPSRLESFQ